MVDPRISRFLTRLARAIRESRVEFSIKAQRELLEMNWPLELALEVLTALTPADFRHTESSRTKDGAVIWVFTPEDLEEGPLWVRLEEIGGIFVISFHPQEEP